jgi:hypothetical protein
MVNPDATIRLFSPDDGSDDLLLISNDANAMEIALEVARETPGVNHVEVGEQDTTDYIPPGSPAGAGQIGDQGPYKYRVYVDNTSLDAVGPQLVDRLERELARRNIICSVMFH